LEKDFMVIFGGEKKQTNKQQQQKIGYGYS